MVTTRTVRLIDRPPHRPPQLSEVMHSIAIALQHMGQGIGQMFEPTCEPTVVKGRDPHGNPYWEIYDPNTERTMFCMSETEVDVWLDYLVRRH